MNMSEFLLITGKSVFAFWGLSGFFLIRALLIIFLVLIKVSQLKKNAFKLFINILLVPLTSIWLSINLVEIDTISFGGYVGEYLKRVLVKYYTMDSLEIFFEVSLFVIEISEKLFFVIR
jgi:hypothetical protein